MKPDNLASQAYIVAVNEAHMRGHEFVTPEHLLYAALLFESGRALAERAGGRVAHIQAALQEFFALYLTAQDAPPTESDGFTALFRRAGEHAVGAGKEDVAIGDLLAAIFELPESHAAYIMSQNGITRLSLLRAASAEAERPAAGAEAKTPLTAYSVDMTARAREGAYDPLIGREAEIERTLQVLCRRVKNNPLHVGDAGVGKTAIVEGLARRIAEGGAPAPLAGAHIYHVDMANVVAGTRYRGDFEDRLVKLLDAAAAEKGAIIYLDEIHNAVGAGMLSGGAMDAAGILKPYLARGELRVIGSTTYEEYRKWFEKDAALTRRFQRIDITEPDAELAEGVLRGLKSRYEAFHNVTYTDDALAAAVRLSVRYMPERRLPDKAIDIIDEAGASLAVAPPGSARANGSPAPRIAAAEIERAVARMARLPEDTVSADERDKLATLEADVQAELFGQAAAVRAAVRAVQASRLGLGDEGRPVASLLFVGPTGVGKTELARLLARQLNMPLRRFDMSEYQEPHAVSRLIGAPPGYVGYDEGGLLTDCLRKTPRCVLLLDEIEKAHADVRNVLLQALDYGTLTDNTGKKADFTNCLLIMTSNAGAEEYSRRPIGLTGGDSAAAAKHAFERLFSPEFRNRLSETVFFNKLDMDMATRIAEREIAKLSAKLAARGVTLRAPADAAGRIAEAAMANANGAREILRAVTRDMTRPIVDALLNGKLPPGATAAPAFENGEWRVDAV